MTGSKPQRASARRRPRDRARTGWHLAELCVVFGIGLSLSQFFFSSTGQSTGKRANLAGNDGYYHVKMAALLPEIGLPKTFPWLRETIFNDRFVSHHYGFHAFLCPFVLISHQLTGEYIPGARWAMSLSFGLVLAAAMLILMSQGIRLRWLWLALLLALPADFYIRHTYVRAIDLSLLCLLVGCFFILRRRYLAAALTLAVYTHVYLGSFFLIVIAVIHLLSGLLARRGARFDWRLAVWIAAGALVGLITHPYFPESIGFLRTQIFGSGLTPEIRVGREWNAYGNVWDFANLIGPPLWAVAIALALRVRRGPRLSRNEWTMLVTSFVFFALLLKARRFVEYWPVFAVLAAAMLAGPLFGGKRGAGQNAETRGSSLIGQIVALGALIACVAALAVFLFTPAGGQRPAEHVRYVLRWTPLWAALALAYLLVAVIGPALSQRRVNEGIGRLALHIATAGAMTVALPLLLLIIAGPQLETVRRWAGGRRNLEAIEPAMKALRQASNKGDVVFTDDWDVFPVYFYLNHWNHYVVGLDPVFSYRHDPEMWARYVKISRGEIPSPATVKKTVSGETADRRIHVTLEDIRDQFHARFVVVDHEHRKLARRLEAVPDFAERIYPAGELDEAKPPPFSVYRVLGDPVEGAPRSLSVEN
jgi:hypothetical protein